MVSQKWLDAMQNDHGYVTEQHKNQETGITTYVFEDGYTTKIDDFDYYDPDTITVGVRDTDNSEEEAMSKQAALTLASQTFTFSTTAELIQAADELRAYVAGTTL